MNNMSVSTKKIDKKEVNSGKESFFRQSAKNLYLTYYNCNLKLGNIFFQLTEILHSYRIIYSITYSYAQYRHIVCYAIKSEELLMHVSLKIEKK